MENPSLSQIKNQIDNQTNQEKKPRGRPRKETNQTTNNQTSNHQTHQTNSHGNQSHIHTPYSEALIPSFKATFEFVDEALADFYKDETLKNNSAQNEFLSKQASESVQDFVPTMNSKYLKLFILVLSLLVIYGKKFILIKNKEEKKKQEEKLKKDSAIDVPTTQKQTGPFSVHPTF